MAEHKKARRVPVFLLLMTFTWAALTVLWITKGEWLAAVITGGALVGSSVAAVIAWERQR